MTTESSWDAGTHFAVASTRVHADQAHVTVASVLSVLPAALVDVLDVDGTYVPVGSERVLTAADVGLTATELHRALVLLDPAALACRLATLTLRAVTRDAEVAVWLAPGVRLLAPPSALAHAATVYGLALVARCPGVVALPAVGTLPPVAEAPNAYATEIFAVASPADPLLALWDDLVASDLAADHWVDLAAGCHPHETDRHPQVLVTADGLNANQDVSYDSTSRLLCVDGHPVTAVDLTGFDPSTPWLFDARRPTARSLKLSDHPALAALCHEHGHDLAAARALRLERRPTHVQDQVELHPHLRHLYRAATRAWLDGSAPEPPDPIDPQHADLFTSWLLEPVSAFEPIAVTRYLATIYESRTDLQLIFPFVPGHQSAPYLRWVADHGAHESDYSPDLIRRSLVIAAPSVADQAGAATIRTTQTSAPRPRPPGVNVVGFLHGELGIGESARLMMGALTAAGIPHSSLPIRRILQSRQSAEPQSGTSDEVYDTTLLCVNADLTPTIARALPDAYAPSYKIGMWYWEAEAFPASQHAGFAHLDEIWVATDFIRDALAPHTTIPVTTIAPPLPQASSGAAAQRSALGLPDAPVFLFAFDFLSTAARKNPWGLVDAFRAAFARGEGPVLVIKSINADRRFADAERLRLRVADEPDIILIEEYLSAADRDALMSTCDCYVSLHRSEGLGLTIAEAMAHGKPVIATAYSGNMHFMTEENSFPVPWSSVPVGTGHEPYPADGTWAEPDIDAAAALMRLVVADPDLAAARGARAALDIRTRFSSAAAGERIARRLAEIRSQRSTPSTPSTPPTPSTSVVRRAAARIGGLNRRAGA
jgi:glycosyltransferase involved in cell wall biosynthesis